MTLEDKIQKIATKILKEYDIDTNGLTIYNLTMGNQVAFIKAEGRIGATLYFGYYEPEIVDVTDTGVVTVDPHFYGTGVIVETVKEVKEKFPSKIEKVLNNINKHFSLLENYIKTKTNKNSVSGYFVIRRPLTIEVKEMEHENVYGIFITTRCGIYCEEGKKTKNDK